MSISFVVFAVCSRSRENRIVCESLRGRQGTGVQGAVRSWDSIAVKEILNSECLLLRVAVARQIREIAPVQPREKPLGRPFTLRTRSGFARWSCYRATIGILVLRAANRHNAAMRAS